MLEGVQGRGNSEEKRTVAGKKMTVASLGERLVSIHWSWRTRTAVGMGLAQEETVRDGTCGVEVPAGGHGDDTLGQRNIDSTVRFWGHGNEVESIVEGGE
jgi:hypothetical protein